jgi:hypothetical protein
LSGAVKYPAGARPSKCIIIVGEFGKSMILPRLGKINGGGGPSQTMRCISGLWSSPSEHGFLTRDDLTMRLSSNHHFVVVKDQTWRSGRRLMLHLPKQYRNKASVCMFRPDDLERFWVLKFQIQSARRATDH